MELIRDPLWQFAGFLVGVAAMVLTWYVFKKQKSVKQLGYNVSVARIMSDGLQIDGKIEVLFNGERTIDPYLVTIKIANIGTVAVPSSDYEVPLTLSLGEKATILSARITDVNPSDIKQHARFDLFGHQRIVFQKFLMNPKDSVTIQVIVDQFESVELTGRIIGMSSLKHLTKPIESNTSKDFWFIAAFLPSLGILSGMVTNSINFLEGIVMLFVSSIVGGVFLFLGFWLVQLREKE